MDSGNSSGSVYSSGSEEEYDSRGDSISLSAFLNGNPNPPHGHLGDGIVPSHHHQLQPPRMGAAVLHHSPTIQSMSFDPLSNIFDPLPTRRSDAIAAASAASSPILNLDTAASWYKTPSPYHNAADLIGFGQLAPTTVQLQPPFLGYDQQGQNRTTCFPVASEPEGGLKQLGSISGSVPNELATSNAAITTTANSQARNPKKRSRASRRAPTTVLTTDTNNFRAMVQEFTGIPAPPFTSSSSSPFQRSRLDLFSSASGAPSYLLRPFSQKPQPPPVLPPFSSSFPTSIIDALASSTTTGNGIASTELGFLRPTPPSFLSQSMPNPLLDFQSLFQAPGQKYPPAGSSLFPTKTLVSSDNIRGLNDSHLKIGAMAEFCPGQVDTQLHRRLMNLQSSNMTLSNDSNSNGNDNNGAPPANLHGDEPGSGANTVSNQAAGVRRPNDGNLRRIQENTTRGKDTVESWICSSD
ncbi:hypothetical protein SAY86_017102 [Trapa natans]|uniref:VQ domain-containing protein n=1 Tax=Trapa natans TaxID=22666 RepID=A0AAN7R8H5_TRANT|nr:hypothetical protein SAY86_017102 [Trapa natans]